MIINSGKNSVSGEDADFLIFYSSDVINLPREYIVNRFPYGKYFEKEDNPLLILLIPIFIIYYVTLSIYRQAKNSILRLLKRPTVKYTVNEKPPLTALQFADIMIDIWEQYQKENKK
ncbi:hypothetical protein [Commensalibacter papalotli (ex Servin-Garciduenas et al. 2014)]|uniref:Uncharacterized protein n=1 Tax=Commensalibacter papalotli (ex Servin-Garciduenas et al. 2014) TaxID=1208583 RepID=W7DXU1_9PROT|nr:hypothetical protein [Commensalibacter papalotli (ex Servin-Garciduenas et al. 2014)]EUK17434.1 hypothetical protein COMX_10278 [Commensalibacter papalotli (ex Servin-Garciduenas et al. 2014)]